MTAHIGAFWNLVRSEFPRIQDAGPLANIVEGAGPVAEIGFQFTNLPPLRRSWLLSEDGRNLIQLQEDRFLFNWKRSEAQDPYPNYSVVYAQFERHLARFLNFCEEMGVGPITMRQFELVYVNHISNANGLEEAGVTGPLVDHVRDMSTDRFLPEPEGFNWTTVYQLPESLGRLHIAAQTAVNIPNQEKLVRLDITARGIGKDQSVDGRREWFKVAHEWITHGFADITSPSLHGANVWGRTS